MTRNEFLKLYGDEIKMKVIIRENERGKYGIIPVIQNLDRISKVVEKKGEFCLLERASHDKVEAGQMWEAEIVRTIVDKVGKEIKILRPTTLIHKCEVWYKHADQPVLTVSSYCWHKDYPCVEETQEEEFEDELIKMKIFTPVLRGRCPVCQKEVSATFAPRTEIIKQPTPQVVLNFYTSILGSEFEEVCRMKRELEMDVLEVLRDYEKKSTEVWNKISDLEEVGIIRRKATEHEIEAVMHDAYRDWMKSGGDPFDEPDEPLEYVVEIVDSEKRLSALQKANNLKESVCLMRRATDEKIARMKEEFENNPQVRVVTEKCREIVYKRIYPCVRDAIEKYDLWFNLVSLKLMHPIDAVEYVIRALREYIQNQENVSKKEVKNEG